MYTQNKGSQMKTSIGKWGNSAAVRIPGHLLQQAQLEPNQKVKLSVSKGVIQIEPDLDSKPLLDDLLNSITEDNLHGETDFGTSGRELL